MGDNEFLYEDIKNRIGQQKEGYRKIKKCCEIAAADGYKHVWVDTCCIDKSSSAELSEAINSMFQWYMDSSVCYTYLFDVNISGGQGKLVSKEQLAKLRWVSRCWTLQELIAPNTVRFFSSDWTECGSQVDLAIPLYEVKNIDRSILRRLSSDEERTWLYSLSVSKRMSWAATRETTRTEDKTYCLLGLFNVSMAMLYGEGGTRAFHRLQEEIMKYSTDQTILSWSPADQDPSKTMSVLADSPSAFHDGSRLLPLEQNEHFEMATKGLRIASRLYDPVTVDSEGKTFIQDLRATKYVLLSCIYADNPRGQVAIELIKADQAGGERVGSSFMRVMQNPVVIQVRQLRAGDTSHKGILCEIGCGPAGESRGFGKPGQRHRQISPKSGF